MPRRDPQPVAVGQGADRRGAEDRPLLFQPADQPVGDAGDLLAAEDADEVIDPGPVLEQLLLLPLGQAAGDDHAPRAALLLQVQHLVDAPRTTRPGPAR